MLTTPTKTRSPSAPANRSTKGRRALPARAGGSALRRFRWAVHDAAIRAERTGMATIADRCANEGLCAMGLRSVRTRRLRANGSRRSRSGSATHSRSSRSTRAGQRRRFRQGAHSVLTDEAREVDGQPAYEARKRVVEFLMRRLA